MGKKVAVVLSGCGYLDGSEINEAVFVLLACSQYKAEVSAFAPPTAQNSVINHITNNKLSDTRNVLVESARIVRGNIADLSKLRISDCDAVVLPGGYGVASILSNITDVGANATVIQPLYDFLYECLMKGKPIGAICISPALLGVVARGKFKLKMTLGGHNNLLDALGMEQIKCSPNDIVIDEQHRVVTTPAFMCNPVTLTEVYTGIEKLIGQLLHMA